MEPDTWYWFGWSSMKQVEPVLTVTGKTFEEATIFAAGLEADGFKVTRRPTWMMATKGEEVWTICIERRPSQLAIQSRLRINQKDAE